MESIVQGMVESLNQAIPPELTIAIISLLPILELRGGMLAATLLGVDIWRAFFICGICTMIPIPFILLFINRIFDWMRNTRFVKLVNKLEEKAEKKSAKINQYKTIGLFVFVAIPLPGTGAWTGALAAALMRMPFRYAILSIGLGTLGADIIMALVSYGLLGGLL